MQLLGPPPGVFNAHQTTQARFYHHDKPGMVSESYEWKVAPIAACASCVRNTEAGILARTIQAEEGALSGGAAEYLLSVRFGERDVALMNELSELARQGKLTAQEQAELDSYLHVSNLLALMQSQGRRALQRSTQ